MGGFGVGSFNPIQQRLFSFMGRHDLSRTKLEEQRVKKMKKKEWQCYAMSDDERPNSNSKITMKKTSTYTTRISTDIPLYESLGATFDHYLEDKSRVFNAIFPDKRRSQQLNEEEWRIQMLPVNLLHLKVRPVVDMRLRCKTKGVDYPPQIPRHVTKVLELDTTRLERHELDRILQPSQFSLGVKGALYPDRQGSMSRLKGQLEMSISFLLPRMLALVRKDILRAGAESLLQRLAENMKDEVNSSLLADYSRFKEERN